MNTQDQKQRSSVKSSGKLWIVVWIVSFLLIFEAPIRSIGKTIHVYLPSQKVISLFSLSDVGLLFPLLILLMTSKLNSKMIGKRRLLLILLVFVYGLLIALLRSNQIHDIAYDLRLFVALLSGLALAATVGNRPSKFGMAICVVSGVSMLFILISLFFIPDFNIWNQSSRLSSLAIFMLVGIPLMFFAPCIAFSTYVQKRRLQILSWLVAGLLLFVSTLFLQTRSLVITIIIVLLIASVAAVSLHNKRSNKLFAAFFCLIVLMTIFISVVYFYKGKFDSFISRTDSAIRYTEDANIMWRFSEAELVMQSLDYADYIFGMGLGPSSPLFTATGNPTFVLHIGILNIWWRFGFAVFVWVVLMSVNLFRKWVATIFWLFSSKKTSHFTKSSLATVICAPGVFCLMIISLISGGWDIISMLSLGLIWGFHRSLSTCAL